MRVAPGPTCHAASRVIADSPLNAWRLLINETMLRHIRRCTNEESCRQSDRAEDFNVSVSELETTFGLFYAKGLFFSPKTPLRLLWGTNSSPLFANAMSRNRFYKSCDTCALMKSQQEASGFSETSLLWHLICGHLSLKIASNVSIPLKTWRLTNSWCLASADADTFNTWRISLINLDWSSFSLWIWKRNTCATLCPYLGKFNERIEDETLSLHVVKKLMRLFEDRGQNVTANNFFSSLKLVRYLHQKSTSYVETMRINKHELPDVNNIMKDDEKYATRFYKTEDHSLSLTLYNAKKNKVVCLISSFHTHPSIPAQPSEKKKTNVMLDYNWMKCGLSCFDATARMYSTRSASHRWPLYIL